MATGDGNGWVTDAGGDRHWGRFGAAGLVLRAPAPPDRARTGRATSLVLLQLRVGWSHHGGTWGLPGGARDSHETAVETALRETWEETGIDPAAVAVRGEVVDDLAGDPCGWTYTTVVGDVRAPLPTVTDRESDALEWVPDTEVAERDLHPGLRASWSSLWARPVRLLVDAANVVGSVPDGWWRDRPGANSRLLAGLAAVTPRTVALDGAFLWTTGVLAVVEGQARQVAGPGAVDVVRATASGDDALVDTASSLVTAGEEVAVVTADRGLIGRLPAGTPVVGPRRVRSWVAGAVAPP